MHLWHKRVSTARADHWIDHLRPVVDPARLVVVTPASGRSVRLEIYCDAKREADALAKNFGGQVQLVRDENWQPAPRDHARPPAENRRRSARDRPPG